MTNEEAIEVLKNDIEICTIQQKQACDMAIKALEQTELNSSYNSVKPELDCISREAVEKITWEEPSYTDALNVLTEVREKVRALPSVTPKAEWIPCSEGLPEDESKLFIVTVNINNVKYVYHELVGCDGETWHIGGMGEELPFDVVAYMPLPQPYTGSEDEET